MKSLKKLSNRKNVIVPSVFHSDKSETWAKSGATVVNFNKLYTDEPLLTFEANFLNNFSSNKRNTQSYHKLGPKKHNERKN